MGGDSHPSVPGAGGPDVGGPLRKRNIAMAGLDSSPGSVEDMDDADSREEKKRQPVKRACNECRQQKVSVYIVPVAVRVVRQTIESNFKRVGKRSRNAEMEREIIELRKQIATVHTGSSGPPPSQLPQLSSSIPTAQHTPKPEPSSQVSPAVYNTPSMSSDHYMGSHEAVASLLDLRSGFDGSNYMRNGSHHFKRIEDVVVVPDRVTELFDLFFTFYHPFLPFLDREQTPDIYYNASPLLFWTIISVGARRYQTDNQLLNSLAGPVSRLVAMQLGLHRPSHTQDFSKFRVELIEEELRDKVRTWAICNIVAQRDSMDPNFKLPEGIWPRLEIEKFCDKVTKALYTNRRDPVGLCGDRERSALISFLSRDFDELESQLKPQNDCITELYLRASNLHLQLSAFFDDTTVKDYRERLLSLYVATTTFLEAAMNLKTSVGPVLSYTPYYVYQMLVAGGCTLLKLSKSFFAAHIDMEYTKNLFNRTIWAIRGVSVTTNDLPERLAEVLAQMWRLGSAPHPRPPTENVEMDDSLMLKVRCRMSMSLLFDSVWRWREDNRTKGRNIEAYLKNPTNPDSNAESSASSSVGALQASSSTPGVPGADPSLAPAPLLAQANLGVEALPSGFMEPNYEVFDPLNWLLDGLVDLPYSYSTMAGMEAQGIA
ncbi:hypothetical protein FE257_002374 [Aspergillus nanangensis]|uniref:Transcription factor domain-containing protein n=1 Tax=Aspergillus nanangensis TaxID=2582783 RepID=A0AAD4GP36_ASPNN|nr:hypothetical protein FE257_002374 [Aspergillus nanangensis]